MVHTDVVAQEGDLDLTVLISCYFEELSIEEFYSRLSRTLNGMGITYEIIFVNDGSTDRTYEILCRIFDQDPNVTAVIDFFGNAGQANAKTPAVMLSRGKGLLFLDSDLQLAPEEIPLLMEKFLEGYHVVSGYRENRKDSWARTIPSRLANMIMRKASNSNLKDFGCTFKIYNGRLVRGFGFNAFKPWRHVPVIAMATKMLDVPVTHYPRRYGKSGWTFKKLMALNMENLLNFSERPFQFISLACIILFFMLVVRILVAFIYPGAILSNITPGLILNVLIAGIVAELGVLCLIGEFIIRNFNILQKRPAFVIREIRSRGDDAKQMSDGVASPLDRAETTSDGATEKVE